MLDELLAHCWFQHIKAAAELKRYSPLNSNLLFGLISKNISFLKIVNNLISSLNFFSVVQPKVQSPKI